MKILSAAQIRELDQYTIANEPVSSLDLMERAASACVKELIRISAPHSHFYVYCGKGNNGGDGLAISRLLCDAGYKVTTFVIHHAKDFSADALKNFRALKDQQGNKILEIYSSGDLPEIPPGSAIIAVDALLGTGSNRPAEGLLADCIDYLNQAFSLVVSIDLPSGLFADSSSAGNKHIVKSSLCLTFQLPKLCLMFAANKEYVRQFKVLDIGLSAEKINLTSTNNYFITAKDLKPLIRKREKFSHKGTYGHALLIAGSKGKSGAAVLSARATLRSGAGLLTVHSNAGTLNTLLNHLPEAMTEPDRDEQKITEMDVPDQFDALAFGPGVGTHEDTQLVLKKLLNYFGGKMVIDADGLNILSENKTWLDFLPPSTVLTPHPKEFERLTEKITDDFERLETARNFSTRYNCVLVLKGSYTAIAMPDGNVFFNSSGNPGLAKGGTGDVLTGIILGLLTRGYNAPQAALIGTYVHGCAADLCAKNMSLETILATDVIEHLPQAFKIIEDN
jgi:NAD(P)H-hydrate epimerase